MKTYRLIPVIFLLVGTAACKKDETATDKSCYISVANGYSTVLFNADGSVKTIKFKSGGPDINLLHFNGGTLAEDEAIIDSVLLDNSGRLAFMKLKVIENQKYERPYIRRYEYDAQGQLLQMTNQFFDTTLVTRFTWESGDLKALSGLRPVPDRFTTQRRIEYNDTLSPETYSSFIYTKQTGYHFTKHLIKSNLEGEELTRYRYQLDASGHIRKVYYRQTFVDQSGRERSLSVDSIDAEYRCD